MKIADMEYLLAHDSQTNWECPAGFDYWASLAEVRDLGSDLSVLCGYPLTLSDQVQDASFFAAWSIYEKEARKTPDAPMGVIDTIVSIRFSAFGRMYSIWGCSDLHPVREDTKARVIDFLSQRGFVFAPDALLDLPYHRPEMAGNWQIRYFNYL